MQLGKFSTIHQQKNMDMENFQLNCSWKLDQYNVQLNYSWKLNQ